jgi:uncharacterized membrane protein (DUF485 family)
MLEHRVAAKSDPSYDQLHRRVVRGVWVMTIGFIVVFFSGSFSPLVAYGAILCGAALIGHGGNIVVRTLMTEGLRLHRQ